MGNKVFVFGIDGAPPELILGEWLNDLPTIKSLMERGCYAKLNSTIPPSTIIAWNSMMSGKDASEVGVFSYTYKDEEGKTKLANSSLIKTKLVWDILTEQNKKSISLYVPLSYPVTPINGCKVSGFMTPSVESNCTYPSFLKDKIKSYEHSENFFDVAVGLAGHKGMGIPDLLEKIYQMTDMQLNLFEELLIKEDWDFSMAVMIGTDRLQHMLWNHFDPTHRKFVPNSPHKNALKDYYKYIDKRLGEILKLLDKETTIIVTSDHGMVKQEGKININNWLIEQGYLVLKEGVDLSEKKRFNLELIDMEKTLAYGGGAYNARVYINKAKVGEDYERVREELIEKLKAIPDDSGKTIKTKIYKKEDIYKKPESSECPDLTIYFDELRWASNPDLGQEGIYSWETAVGADSAGHSQKGSFIISGNQIENKGNIGEIDIRQVAPTVLRLLDAEIPKDIKVDSLDVLMKGQYPEASLIDTTDGMQFKVYANSHPEGFVIAKPKYIPESLIEFTGMKKRFIFEQCMTRFNLFTKKEIVEENLKKLNEKFPEYIYECDNHKNWFLGVPIERIKKTHDTKRGIKELMKVPESDLDDYLKSVRSIIEIMGKSGVSIDEMGISHSTLLGNYTPGKSDIDLLVFGIDNGWKVINFLEKVQHPSLKWKTKEEWARYYKDRVISDHYTEEEYVHNMARKRDDGLFNGHVFSIFVVEKPEEATYSWEDKRKPLGLIKVKATIKDAHYSIVRPGLYEIEDVEVLSETNTEPSKIRKIINWARPFTLQAKKGEKVEVCGLLEYVRTKNGEEFHQIVLGYFDTYTTGRGNKEYLKALIE